LLSWTVPSFSDLGYRNLFPTSSLIPGVI